MANLIDQIHPLSAPLCSHVDYFSKAADLKKMPPSGQERTQMFPSAQTAYHLNRDPSFKMSINDVATLFNILDLHEALSDYIQVSVTLMMDISESLVVTARHLQILNYHLHIYRCGKKFICKIKHIIIHMKLSHARP